jgi:chromosome partitioning protein
MQNERKPRVITLYLSKGGVAKSTLAALIATFLAGLGFRVVIPDLDRQGAQSEIFDLIDERGQAEVLHAVLKRHVDIREALTPIEGSLLPVFKDHSPGTLALVQGGAQTQLAIDDIRQNPVRYGIADTLDLVRGVVRDLGECADFVVMDMGPSDEASALAGLVATDELLIPTKTDYTSVTRLAPVLGEVRVARQVQPDLNILGIVPVMTGYYFGRLRQSKSTLIGKQFLEENYADLLFRDKRGSMVDLPYDDAWPSAMWAGQTIFSGEVPDKIQTDALRFLNAVGGWLGVEEVKR